MMSLVPLLIGCGLVLAVMLIVLASFRERPSVKAKLMMEKAWAEFPVRVDLSELETRVHRQVMEIQEIVGAYAPPAAAPPSPEAAKPKSEHDTRMIRMVTEKAEEIQRLTDESVGRL